MAIEYDQLGNVIQGDQGDLPLTSRSSARPAGTVKSSIVDFGERAVPGVPEGAEPEIPEMPQVVFQDINGNTEKDDLRVRILVPPKYITDFVAGPDNEITKNGGILFPYTPSISYEAKAEYAEAKPLHSNFSINFYQRSTIGNISISGKFSVENSADAEIYLATMHLLKSLTRMRSGGITGDPDSGAPPPVCRLYANGESMLHNVPVAIASYRIEMPDSVDYFTIFENERFGTTAVPTISTIAITCIPMYSRNEMQQFSVSKYTSGLYKRKGYI
jgi:hypothetical protein